MGQQTLLGKTLEGEVKPKSNFNNSKPDWVPAAAQGSLTRMKDGKCISKEDEEYTKEYCIDQIEGELYLWDMRCWDKYKDPTEVAAWVEAVAAGKEVPQNMGHSMYCIERLLAKGWITKDELVQLILKNPNKQFSARLVKCFDNPRACPKFKAQGDYGNDLCKDCTKGDSL